MVIQEITKMQQAFLWNGDANHRRINRVSWFLIYKSKFVWGLGVKHCKMFNHALLSKWAWKILGEVDSLWHNVLSFRYGDINTFILDLTISFINNKTSLWWRDLGISLVSYGATSSWFDNYIIAKVVSRFDIDFWRHSWCEVVPLTIHFPLLFENQQKPKKKIV